MAIKKLIPLLLFLFPSIKILAQQPNVDSLQKLIALTQNDTARMMMNMAMADAYAETKPESELYYANESLLLARKMKFRLNEVDALIHMGYALINMGNFPRALQTLLSAKTIAEDPKSEENIIPEKYQDRSIFLKQPVTPHMLRMDMIAQAHHFLGILYANTLDFEKQLFQDLPSRQISEETGNAVELCLINLELARVYLSLHKPDSALACAEKAYNMSIQTGYKKYLGSIFLNMGRIYVAKGNPEMAADYFKKALIASQETNYLRGVIASNLYLADLYRQAGKEDSNWHYVSAGLGVAKFLNSPELLLRSYTAMAGFYRGRNNNDSAVKYQELIIKMKDSLFNSKQAKLFENIDFDAQQRQQEIQAAKKAYQDRLQKYLLLAGLAGLLLVAAFLWRINQHRQKSNLLLQKQKEEIEMALHDLKTTQAQLIQSEKMASLGQLTAGIAHEIENPLNFVNNFSELNTELIQELKIQKSKLGTEHNEKLETELLNDIELNLEKIAHHGRRADAIVKSMMQHSHSSTGQKEPADISALAEEYLRLAYHGFRAKNKNFMATLETQFDESLPPIQIVPQDIGQVLVNIYNNAFSALSPGLSGAGRVDSIDVKEPTVWVSTKRSNDKVIISVKDNGTGISEKVLDKIFQPFFTTKPTGQGTGLGLSLSYDVIKAHGGTIRVENREGEGAGFIIELPLV